MNYHEWEEIFNCTLVVFPTILSFAVSLMACGCQHTEYVVLQVWSRGVISVVVMQNSVSSSVYYLWNLVYGLIGHLS